jgi:hypothetical protein
MRPRNSSLSEHQSCCWKGFILGDCLTFGLIILYSIFVIGLKLYKDSLSKKSKSVLRVTSIFCEFLVLFLVTTMTVLASVKRNRLIDWGNVDGW